MGVNLRLGSLGCVVRHHWNSWTTKLSVAFMKRSLAPARERRHLLVQLAPLDKPVALPSPRSARIVSSSTTTPKAPGSAREQSTTTGDARTDDDIAAFYAALGDLTKRT